MRPAVLSVLSAITVALLGTSVASAAQSRASAHQDFPPRPGATPIVIGLPNLNPPTATPGPAHASPPPKGSAKPSTPPDAVRLALSNTYVRALLSGKPYRVKSVNGWSAGKIVRVVFYHPATITGTWLAAGKAPYRATYRNVKSIQVFVNTSLSRVVATVPYPRLRS
jgi:hypothetical protein